jgi:hypothetical protein
MPPIFRAATRSQDPGAAAARELKIQGDTGSLRTLNVRARASGQRKRHLAFQRVHFHGRSMKRRTMTLALASAIAAPGASFAASKEEPQAEVRKAATYMKIAEVQAGIGMGVKKFKLVWVFETEKAPNEFVNSGWEFGAPATAAAKTGDKGNSYQ